MFVPSSKLMLQMPLFFFLIGEHKNFLGFSEFCKWNGEHHFIFLFFFQFCISNGEQAIIINFFFFLCLTNGEYVCDSSKKYFQFWM